jgi:hypothetical protein
MIYPFLFIQINIIRYFQNSQKNNAEFEISRWIYFMCLGKYVFNYKIINIIFYVFILMVSFLLNYNSIY